VKEKNNVKNASSSRITDTENKLYATNHAVLGYIVSRVLKLPEYLRIAIRDHHNFERLKFNRMITPRKRIQF